mmetsp:Transcript_41487/g.69150  ORF Transcript_41487/g.69150 Transcript_41487/m.69150 type:complete len:103 (-) Transcript_41487:590-898(-)
MCKFSSPEYLLPNPLQNRLPRHPLPGMCPPHTILLKAILPLYPHGTLTPPMMYPKHNHLHPKLNPGFPIHNPPPTDSLDGNYAFEMAHKYNCFLALPLPVCS